MKVLMHLTNRCLIILSALTSPIPVPGFGQIEAIRRNQLSLDVGPLEGGLSYARRLGEGR
jgi:hypothetical protein